MTTKSEKLLEEIDDSSESVNRFDQKGINPENKGPFLAQEFEKGNQQEVVDQFGDMIGTRGGALAIHVFENLSSSDKEKFKAMLSDMASVNQ